VHKEGKMLKMQFTGSVEVMFFKDDGMIVAHCPTLALSTCGRDIDEAKKGFEGCLKIYLEETVRHGTLEKDLMKLGWKAHPLNMTLTPPGHSHYKNIPTHILESIQIPVPTPA